MKENKYNEFAKKYTPWLILVVGFLFTVGYYYKLGMHYLNADVCSEMVLADELNREGTLISKNWFYSTELRVLNTQIVYKIALMVFKDWHIARTFAIAVMLIILVASYLFLMRTIGLNKFAVWSAVILVLPFSNEYRDYVIYGSFYIPHIVISFVSLGIVFRLGKSNNNSIIRRVVKWIVLLILGFCAGMGGIRQIVICYVPLFVTAFLFFVIKVKNVKKVRDIIQERLFGVFMSSFAALCSSLLGYLVNVLYLNNIYSVGAAQQIMKIQEFNFLDFINTLFSSIAPIWNYVGFDELGTWKGISGLSGLMLYILLIWGVVICIKKFNKLKDNEQLLFIFTVIGLVFTALVGSLSGMGKVPRYMLPNAIFLIPIFSIACKNIEASFIPIQLLPAFLVSCCVIIQSYYTTVSMPKYSMEPTQDIIEWLEKQNCTKGYATYWYGNVLTEISNGALEVWTLKPGNDTWWTMDTYNWLQKKEHSECNPCGKFFLVLGNNSEELGNNNINASQLNKYREYSNDSYSVYLFENKNELMDSIR